MLNRVFVYGTLKPGLRYHGVAQRGGKFIAEEASIEGFNLYHLSPENYPAITEGTHRVHGWCFTYENIDLAMPFLDELEGVDSDPPDYKRIQTRVFLSSSTEASGDSAPLITWVYVYQDLERCAQSTAATLVPGGLWLPRDHENGCLERVELEAKSLVVIRNQPMMTALAHAVQAVRECLGRSKGAGVEGLQVVAQFPSLALAIGEEGDQQNEVGVAVSTEVASALMQSLQDHDHQQPAGKELAPTFSLSAVEAGSYVQCIYRGPYYGLDQAWADFATSLCSPDSDFEAMEGAQCFQVFANYGENTLAADLRTDLYIRIV